MGVVLACVVLIAPAIARPPLAAASRAQPEPPALPCLADRALAAALLDEVPRAEVERAGDLVAALEFRDGAWQLELRRAGGKRLLRRSLPLRREECSLAATDSALIIDRYLRALPTPVAASRPAPLQAAEAGPPRAEPTASAAGPSSERPTGHSAAQPTTAAAAAQAAPSASPDSALAAVASAADPKPAPPSMPNPGKQGREAARTVELAEQPRALNLSVSVGIAGLVSGGSVQQGGWIDLAARIPGWSFALSFAAAPGSSFAASGRHGFSEGPLSAGTALVALSARPCVDRWLQVCGGPFLGAHLGGFGVQGYADYSGRRERSAAVQPELGAALVFDLPLPAGFHGGLSLLAGVAPWAARRELAGPAAGQIELVTALTLGYQLF